MYVSYNAPCSPSPPPPTKIQSWITFVFHFSWVNYSRPKRNWRQWLCKMWGAGGGGVQTECITGDVQMANWSKMIFFLIQLKLIFTRIVSYTLKVRVFGTQKWEITLNPMPPCGLIFFQPLLRGGGLSNLAKRINGSKAFRGGTCGSWALYFFF